MGLACARYVCSLSIVGFDRVVCTPLRRRCLPAAVGPFLVERTMRTNAGAFEGEILILRECDVHLGGAHPFDVCVGHGGVRCVEWCGVVCLRNMTLAIFYHAPRSTVDQVVQQAATVIDTDRKPRSIAGYPISIIRIHTKNIDIAISISIFDGRSFDTWLILHGVYMEGTGYRYTIDIDITEKQIPVFLSL